MEEGEEPPVELLGEGLVLFGNGRYLLITKHLPSPRAVFL